MADEDAKQFEVLLELIEAGDYFEYRMAVENVRDINRKDKDGVTLLHHAVRKSCLPAVIATLAKGADPDIADADGITPLTVSIWKGFLHIAAMLLQAGANPNAPDKFGRVPLFFAVRRCDVRAVRLLLDFKADPNALTPIRRRDGTVSDTEKSSLLATAVKSGCYEGIQMLRAAGATLDNGSERPLLLAIQYGKRESLGALLEGQRKEVFANYNGKSFILHVIRSKSTLLPVVAAIAKRQNEKDPSLRFPPEDVRGVDWKKLKDALKMKDLFLPTKFIAEDVAEAERVWAPLDDKTRKCVGKKVSLKSVNDMLAQTSPHKSFAATEIDPLSELDEEEEGKSGIESESDDLKHIVPPENPPQPPPDVPSEECDSLGEVFVSRERSRATSKKLETATDDEFLPDATSISLSFDTDARASRAKLAESSSSARGRRLKA